MSSSSVRKRLQEATPGPWEKEEDSLAITGPVGAARDDRMIIYDEGGHSEEDADLIAHAPTDLALALDVIEIAAELHETQRHVGDPCPLCIALAAFETAP